MLAMAEVRVKNKGGRPTDYTPEYGDQICLEIAKGSNFNRLSKMDEYPSLETLFRWLRTIPEFNDNYELAIKERAHYRFDKVDDVVDELREGKIDAQIARLQIDTIKWQTGKENQKRYGDKVEHSGTIDNPSAQALLEGMGAFANLLQASAKTKLVEGTVIENE